MSRYTRTAEWNVNENNLVVFSRNEMLRRRTAGGGFKRLLRGKRKNAYTARDASRELTDKSQLVRSMYLYKNTSRNND